MKLTKTQQRSLMRKAKSVLTCRRNGNVKYEQAAWEKLEKYAESIGVTIGAGAIIEQAEAWLKRHSVAASMNGIV